MFFLKKKNDEPNTKIPGSKSVGKPFVAPTNLAERLREVGATVGFLVRESSEFPRKLPCFSEIWLEDDPFLLKWYLFREHVSFRGCIPFVVKIMFGKVT